MLGTPIALDMATQMMKNKNKQKQTKNKEKCRLFRKT